ncbi:MAG: carboxypeptidase regulatory-like domain-containing protein [Burkholderiales bacterium]|nr:carboxypeptidase regulatory-like domain-containing protein [Burkholderiales bacterium]
MNKRCRLAAAVALLAALSACGGGSDGPTPVVAAADTLSLGTGQTASVLSNDTVGGAPARVGAGGNASVSFSGTLPQGISAADGVLTAARGAVPGSYTLNYQLCEAAAGSNCTTASVALTVPKPPISAAADTVSLGAGETSSLLANDQLDGVAATAATVVVTTTGTWPTGVTLGADGVLTAGAGAPVGASTLGYRICQAAAATNCADGSVTLSVVARVAVSGRVVDGLTGVPLAGIAVAVGARTAATDAQGQFSVTGVSPSARATVKFTGAGYGEGARIVTVTDTGATGVLARLVPVTASAVLDAGTGGTVTNTAGTARVVLAAASLARADGSTLTGNATVSVTAINPSLDSSLMPGDYTTVSGGNAVSIESYGALGVQIADAAGQPANLRTGQTATIRIPLGTRDENPPATIPLFHFDTAAGRWTQEGTATLQGSGAARYYEGTVSHFSTWNADRISETVWVNGCVADSTGARVAGATVSSDGIDYSGTSGALTDATGAFRIAVRANSLATLIGFKSLLLSNTVRVSSTGSDLTLTDCLVLAANANGVSIKLTWGANPRDLDSHLWTPSGSHVYFSNKGQLTAAPFANLDVDDTSSFGPEVVTLTKLMVGTYKYAVHNYSGYGSGPIAVSGARVELILPGGRTELFVPPASGETASTDYWTLFDLTVDAQCNITLTRTEAYTATPASPPSATPVYCTRS